MSNIILPLQENKESLESITFTWQDVTINGYEVACGIVATKGKNKGMLKTGSPKIKSAPKKVTRTIADYTYKTTVNNYDLFDCAVYRVHRWMQLNLNLNNHMPITEAWYYPCDMTELEQKEFAAFIKTIDDLLFAYINEHMKYAILGFYATYSGII